MIDEAICQKDISRLGLFVEPLDQRIVPVSNLTPVAIVDRKPINNPTRNDQDDKSNCGKPSRQGTRDQLKMPQTPETIGDKQVYDDCPDMQEFLIGQDLD